MPDRSHALGLLALMLLHDSRRDARLRPGGEVILLQEQDRGRWDQEEIREGTALAELALREGGPAPYSVQAAIAALHAEARRPENRTGARSSSSTASWCASILRRSWS
jgi:RNA polymerase sigma-70 factor (ECF subfamily)